MHCPPVIVSGAGAGAGVGLAGGALAVAAGGLQQGLHAGVGVVALHLVTCHVSRVTGHYRGAGVTRLMTACQRSHD